MQIAIVGAGRIGSAFAFQLAREGGHEVTVIARGGSERLVQLRRDNGIVDVKGRHAKARVADALPEATPFDLVIVTTLAHQVDAVLPSLQRSAAKCIQFMFVTFEPERLRLAIGADRCAFGMPFVQAFFDGDGRLKVKIGAGGQKSLMSEQRSVDLFNAAGLPAVLEPHMENWVRSHAPLTVGFVGVCVAGERRHGGASWSETRAIVRGVRECFKVIEALGQPIYPKWKVRFYERPMLLTLLLWTVSRVKSFRTLLALAGGEGRALLDVIIASAGRVPATIQTQSIDAILSR